MCRLLCAVLINAHDDQTEGGLCGLCSAVGNLAGDAIAVAVSRDVQDCLLATATASAVLCCVVVGISRHAASLAKSKPPPPPLLFMGYIPLRPMLEILVLHCHSLLLSSLPSARL